MTELINPLDLLTQALVAKHQGQVPSPEQIGRIISEVNATDLGIAKTPKHFLPA